MKDLYSLRKRDFRNFNTEAKRKIAQDYIENNRELFILDATPRDKDLYQRVRIMELIGNDAYLVKYFCGEQKQERKYFSNLLEILEICPMIS